MRCRLHVENIEEHQWKDGGRVSDAAHCETTSDIQASAVVVFVKTAAAVEAFPVVVVAVLILTWKYPAKINRTANMVNAITAAVALSFTKVSSNTLRPEAVVVAVVSGTCGNPIECDDKC